MENVLVGGSRALLSRQFYAADAEMLLGFFREGSERLGQATVTQVFISFFLIIGFVYGNGFSQFLLQRLGFIIEGIESTSDQSIKPS